MSLPFALVIAMLLDARFGEPDWLWRRIMHPAVIMGRFIAWLEARLNHGEHKRIKGQIALIVLLGVALAIGLAIAALPLQPLPQIICGAILLAQRSLVDHVRGVADALGRSTEEGRTEVAKIVGRDPEHLDDPAIARAAIESGAENLSDGVIAPAFWFLVFGLPGMLVYKAINTADSMIGYRTERYADFGRAAALLDDLVNYAPARLTALLLSLSQGTFAHFQVAQRDAGLHRSPNAGWPEAAMASAINVALAGPRVYAGQKTDDPFVFDTGTKTPGSADIHACCDMLWRGWAAFVILATILALFLRG